MNTYASHCLSTGIFYFLGGVVQSLAFMAGSVFRARSVTRKTPSISVEPPVKGLHGLWSQTLLVTLFIHFQGHALVQARSGARAPGSLSSVKAITHAEVARNRAQLTFLTQLRICTATPFFCSRTSTLRLAPFLENHLSVLLLTDSLGSSGSLLEPLKFLCIIFTQKGSKVSLSNNQDP